MIFIILLNKILKILHKLYIQIFKNKDLVFTYFVVSHFDCLIRKAVSFYQVDSNITPTYAYDVINIYFLLLKIKISVYKRLNKNWHRMLSISFHYITFQWHNYLIFYKIETLAQLIYHSHFLFTNIIGFLLCASIIKDMMSSNTAIYNFNYSRYERESIWVNAAKNVHASFYIWLKQRIYTRFISK